MTAFASSESVVDGLTVNCELRSVNHRYSDIFLKLPERLRFTEIEIRSIMAARLKRGKIECVLSYKKNSSMEQSISINDAAVKALLEATSNIEDQMHSAQTFLRLRC